LLGEPRRKPQPSFIVDFPVYMCHPYTVGAEFAKFVKAHGLADRWVGRIHFGGRVRG